MRTPSYVLFIGCCRAMFACGESDDAQDSANATGGEADSAIDSFVESGADRGGGGVGGSAGAGGLAGAAASGPDAGDASAGASVDGSSDGDIESGVDAEAGASSDSGDDTECSDVCVVGQSKCTSGGLAPCAQGSAGCNEWGTPVPCQQGESCQQDACVKTCVDECESGDLACDDSAEKSCEQVGACWTWSAPAPCEPNEVCQSGACVPAGPTEADVQIYIDNFCNVSIVPVSFDVTTGQALHLTYHNNSVDYDADIWASYGGGYLGLPTGATWSDPFGFCSMLGEYTAYVDININGGPFPACPGQRLYIYCH